MKLFITAPQGKTFERHFPSSVMKQLKAFGTVSMNPFNRKLTREELMRQIGDVDILITHWGTPQVDKLVLDSAPKLKLLAHAAGTVAHIASNAVYERNIPVISANSIMARFVGEGILGYIIAGLRQVPRHDRQMKSGLWVRDLECQCSLLEGSLGFIGLGTVGRFLLDLLRPFGCTVHVYDPYIHAGVLNNWAFASLCSFEEAMSQPIISIHAAQTPETFHMIGHKQLAMMPDDGLLINASRGSLLDTSALIPELQSGRLRAVLDVFEKEGESQDPALCNCEHVILQPHMAAACATYQLTQGIIDDIDRFLKNKPLHLLITFDQFQHMTQE